MQLRLKVVHGKPQGHCLAFPHGEFMFGRGPECDIRPNSDLVSRQHCIVHVEEDGAVIRDLGSRNGTLVNGQLVQGERKLADGDTLQLGPLVLQVILDMEATGPSVRDTAVVSPTDTAMEQPALIGPVVYPLAEDKPAAVPLRNS
jgi:pSer/pThr/pTyr-binding forkhead associated (FHA) protein